MQTTTTVPKELTAATFCVWAFATDQYGAVGANNLTVAPGNNPPVAIISLTSPSQKDAYPAYTKFQLSGVMSSDIDGDPLIYKWSFPNAPQGTFIPCNVTSSTPDPPYTRCFHADLADVTYTMGLTVNDKTVDSPLATFPLRVLADRAPCIVSGNHPFGAAFTDADPSMNYDISVTVDDDGDPVPNTAMPAQVSHFQWFTGKQGEPLEYVDNSDKPTLTIAADPNNLAATLIVRLEVRDRNMAVGDSLIGCDASATTCASPVGSSCYQRVTWVINFAI